MNKKHILIISAVLAVLVAVIVLIFALKGCNGKQNDDVSTPVTSQEDDGNWTSVYDATLVE